MVRATSFADLSRLIQVEVHEIRQGMGEKIKELAREGEAQTKQHIETRGTAKSGKRGRIETGQMRDAVGHKVLQDDTQATRAEYGWLDNTPEWRTYQELGFTHRGGTQVEGMFALRDAGLITEEELQDFVSSRRA